MATIVITNQEELDRILANRRGWLYNRFYRKLHHASCDSFRWGSHPSIANFTHLYETWEDASRVGANRCPVCKPGPYQAPALGAGEPQPVPVTPSKLERQAPPTPPRHGVRIGSEPVPIEVLKRFVEEIEASRLADMSFREDSALSPLPACASGGGLSHYLLLAAAIDVGANSNDIRPFLAQLDASLLGGGRQRGLLDLSADDAMRVHHVIEEEEGRGRLRGWQAKQHVPRILAEANQFVRNEAGGDFDAWARKFRKPAQVVERLAKGIYYQGAGSTEARKKMWMLMRWLVRPTPDLRIWVHFDPSDLMVPVDRHVARFAHVAGILDTMPAEGPFWSQVVQITDFARRMFPEDPARVDYAFFMWGRGRTRQQGDPDTCHGLFAALNTGCALHDRMPCSAHCRGPH